VQEHCREGIPDEVCLLELEWYTKEVIVLYVECERCGQKGCQMEENRGQGVISDRQKWCECQKRQETEAAHSKRRKAQQSNAWAGVPEGAAKEEVGPKGGQTNLQNTERSVVEYWSRKTRHSQGCHSKSTPG